MSDPKPAWGQWFASQFGLFIALGIVGGFGLWLTGRELMVGIVVGCFAFVVGCVIGMMRLERWLDANYDARP